MRAQLCLVTALAVLCFTAPGALAGGAEGAADFSGVWLHPAGESGAVAAATKARRELLSGAAAASSFGETVLPGAYPAPRPVVSFSAFLGGATARSFRRGGQVSYELLTRAQARLAGGLYPDVDVLQVTELPGGLQVKTRVTFRQQRTAVTAAQAFANRLTVNPGPGAPWLDRLWPGSSVSDVVGPSPGPEPQPCTVPNCTVCGPLGRCMQCNAGYYVLAGECKEICNVQNCKQCAPGTSGKVCQECRSGYHTTEAGLCEEDCYVPNCATCSGNSRGWACAACNDGYQVTSGKQCKEICRVANCQACVPFSRGQQCSTCRLGYRASADRRACVSEPKCSVWGCAQCAAGTGGRVCQRCLPNYRLRNGGTRCSWSW